MTCCVQNWADFSIYLQMLCRGRDAPYPTEDRARVCSLLYALTLFVLPYNSLTPLHARILQG